MHSRARTYTAAPTPPPRPFRPRAVVPAGLFQSEFKPQMHIMYGMKVYSIKDGLPKFEKVPAAMGGEDKTIDE